MKNPIQLEPVLAQIEHINDLGKSKWYEVVYFDENWRSYAGSKTFKNIKFMREYNSLRMQIRYDEDGEFFDKWGIER